MGKGQLVPKRQISDTFKLIEFADDNYEFNENSGKFSERVENIEGKGEIACCKQVFLFPHGFQNTCTADN